MDIALIRTFLAVSDTGSFVAASARLFVTQSAVSLRVQRLEDQLGQTLFTRSKAGVALTPSGRAFAPYATSLVKLWEEARQQVAVPRGYAQSLTIGAQYSLWPRLGFRWMDALQRARPTLALRAEVGMPDRLTRFLIEGVVQATLTYMPQSRPGLTVAPVMDDELILTSSFPADGMDAVAPHYVFMDWGAEFTRAHATDLPGLADSGVNLSLGALGAHYIVNRHAAAYLPARAAQPHLDAGRLHLVPGAPTFPYPIWAVFRDDLTPDIAEVARDTLAAVATDAEDAQGDIMHELERLTGHEVETLGDP
ncbi:LysR family transcriptional regulator [Jannaschia donghaensis]|uniref:CysJI operon transcriptional activator n=1 Tax=Jannaschia donghaensis TaxID=420998 RepID=A0A0M6YE55_9RHOB|nr:LysR family transcriptional regulator [Jannaschia donghaensis]CTQ48622.1 CysJI operon transcriptional activator [Jannaschia donghaensis]